MNILKKVLIKGMIIGLLSAVWALPATAIILPDMPTLGISPTPGDPVPTVAGIPVASVHDDFWSYSNQILMRIQKKTPALLPTSTYGNFDFATGSGGLDVLLYTGAVGQDNIGVGPGGAFDFPDPVINQNNPSFAGSWGLGADPTDPANGAATVGQVLAYLQALTPGNTTPAFYMDMNQIGKTTTFNFVGSVTLLDPDTLAIMHTWAFDNSWQANDGVYNEDAMVTPVTVVDLPDPYGTVNHNLGSGKADYIAFAPTMDLSKFDSDLLFVTNFYMTGLNDGYEEIFLTGLGNAPPPPPVPEPSTFALLGVGLCGLVYVVRRKS